MKLKYGSVCSGIEAASVAWHPLGWKPVFFSEIDSAPIKVLKHRFPGVPIHGDFTTIGANDYDPIDLLVGGTPCQSFSIAGKRLGLDDARGNLALESIKLGLRLNAKWFLFENVPGLLSSADGEDFAAFLSAITGTAIKAPKGGWRNSGIAKGRAERYGIAWRILDAQYFGVPQRRRRVFVVGYLGDWRPAAAVLFEPESLRGDITPSREARESPTYDVAPCIGASGRGFERTGETRGQDCLVPGLEAGKEWPAEIAPALTATFGDKQGLDNQHINEGGGGSCQAIVMATGQGGAEIARDQSPSLTCNHEAPILAARPGQGGFFVDGVTHSLTAGGHDASEDGTGRGTATKGVPRPVAFQANASSSQSMNPSEVSPPLDVGKAGAVSVAYDMRGREGAVGCFKGGQGEKAGGIGYDENLSPTLSSADSGTNRTPTLMQGMTVRRLTPRECERLQGFPDDWTLVPNGKGTMADGPRYKMCGNSMAVPVMRWIGERINLVEKIINEKENTCPNKPPRPRPRK